MRGTTPADERPWVRPTRAAPNPNAYDPYDHEDELRRDGEQAQATVGAVLVLAVIAFVAAYALLQAFPRLG